MSVTIEPKYKPGDTVMISDESNMCGGELVIITAVVKAGDSFTYQWRIPERTGSSPEKFIAGVMIRAPEMAPGSHRCPKCGAEVAAVQDRCTGCYSRVSR
jgi:hypothetical protein